LARKSIFINKKLKEHGTMKMPSIPRWAKDAEVWISVGLIFAVSALAFLPLIGQIGYFQDGWWQIWAGRTQSLDTIRVMFSIDRPGLGILNMHLFALIGDNPLGWQIYEYILRLAGAIGVFCLLRSVWPKLRLFTTITTLLYVVYPGFLQWPNAVVYSNHMLTIALVIHSILFTVIAIRSTNKFFVALATGLAILCQIGYLVFLEYFIGLEILRLLLICYLVAQSEQTLKTRSLRALVHWSPYLVILGCFLVWRFFIFKSSRPTTNVSQLLGLYSSLTFSMSQNTVVETFLGFLRSVFFAWTVPPSQLVSITRHRDLIIGVFLAVLACILFWIYFQWMKNKESNIFGDKTVFKYVAWIGLVTVFCAILPVTISNRSIELSIGNTHDRYTFQTVIGVVLLVVGGIFLLDKKQVLLWLPMGLLFLSVLTQYNNAIYFRNAWEIQRQIWWQTSWRIPQIKSGTVLLVNPPGDVYFFKEDYEIWAPANIIYNNTKNTLRVYSQILYPGSVIQVMRGAEERENDRTIVVDRDYDQALVISLPDISSCVHVIDGERPELSLNEPPLVDWVAPYSHIQQIETEASPLQPPEVIFGREPDHDWCYYYEKMTLSRQRGDWQQVVALGEEANAGGFKPLDPSEWMPLIEGYAYTGDLEKANGVIARVYDNLNLRYNLCTSVLKQKENPKLQLPTNGMAFLLDRLCGIR